MQTDALRTGAAARALSVSKVTVIRQCQKLAAGQESLFLPGECWQILGEWRISISAVERITGRAWAG